MRLVKGISSTLAVVALVAAGQVSAQQQRKPNIVILATGGTIAGAAASGTQAGYTSGAVTIDAMLKAVPGATDLANIKGEQIANVGSQDMSFEVLLKVAKRINELLPSPDVDGPLNLYNAIAIAADPAAKARGVLVVMNDWIHAAHSLTKTSTTAVQTFLSPVRGLVGIVAYGKSDWYNIPAWKHTTRSEFDISRVTALPRVDIVYAYVDMPPDAIDSAVKNGAKGIVIAGVGNGNLNAASVQAASRAAKAGVPVVRASRVATGSVGRNVELNDDELGLTASDELNPQKARILLSLALLQKHTPEQLQQLFYQY